MCLDTSIHPIAEKGCSRKPRRYEGIKRGLGLLIGASASLSRALERLSGAQYLTNLNLLLTLILKLLSYTLQLLGRVR